MELDTPWPLLSDLGLELYDVEMVAGTLHVVVTRPGGVDLEALTAANRPCRSGWTQRPDRRALHAGRLEPRARASTSHARPLRSAVGEVVRLRERRENEPTRRLEGTVVTADDTSVTLEDAEQGRVVVAPRRDRAGPHGVHVGREASPRPHEAKSSRHRRARKASHGELRIS